eukprot:m.339193 g.339193  ORF g.339193 m.339193 type:complete len:346 (+) comp18702_c0_seq1:170-1207(+)
MADKMAVDEPKLSPDAAMGLKNFEAANNIQTVSTEDSIYRYDEARHREFIDSAKYAEDPHYFKQVKMSALALLKMVMHARSGGNIEVMGLMQGKIEDETMIIMDAFALPVEGTETRVSAQEDAYAYMFSYQELIKKVGRLENVLGWYHSHPGYGCWLSGIDVSTQRLNQSGQDPFLAVVVDPTRTCTSGKVEIGAFRCYPAGYKPPNEPASEYQTIPLEKIEDFGVHCKSYYSLPITYFKSSLDRRLLELLWNKYWVNTLSSSPLLQNARFISGQLNDLSNKLEEAERQLSASGTRSTYVLTSDKKHEESQLAKCAQDGIKTTIEVINGLSAQIIKDKVFNQVDK